MPEVIIKTSLFGVIPIRETVVTPDQEITLDKRMIRSPGPSIQGHWIIGPRLRVVYNDASKSVEVTKPCNTNTIPSFSIQTYDIESADVAGISAGRVFKRQVVVRSK